MASRFAEFRAQAEVGREERARVQALSGRATIAATASGSSIEMELAVSRLEPIQNDMRRNLEESLNIEPHSVAVNDSPKTPKN
jgi:hypothetical protein